MNLLENPLRIENLNPDIFDDSFKRDILKCYQAAMDNSPLLSIVRDDDNRSYDLSRESLIAKLNTKVDHASEGKNGSHRAMHLTRTLTHHLLKYFKDAYIAPSGNIYYPPGGYMGWHTNDDRPGYRFYINVCDVPHMSSFLYYDNTTDTIHELIDELINFRLFKVDKENSLWHAVSSDCNRISFGFCINPK